MARKSDSVLAATLNAIPAGRPRKKGRPLTEEEGRVVVSAYRRGVPIRKVVEAIDGNTAGNMYQKVGLWALQFCRCHKGAK